MIAKAQAVKKSVIVKKHAKKVVIELPKQPEPKLDPKEIQAKAHVLIVEFKVIGNQRKIDSSHVKTDADPKWVKAQKLLIASDTVNEIRAIGYRTKTYIRSHCLPSLLKDGAYLIPRDFATEADKRITADDAEIQKLVDKLVNEWDDMLAEAKKRLGKLYRESDYPRKEALHEVFGIKSSFKTISVPVDLEGELYEKEMKKAERDVQEAVETWKGLLRAEFGKLVEHLVERLSPSKDGKKKIFRDTAITNFTEWEALFNSRNELPRDVQLKALVEKAKNVLKGTNPEALREDEKARELIRSNFTIIKNTLSTMVATQPSREVSFEED